MKIIIASIWSWITTRFSFISFRKKKKGLQKKEALSVLSRLIGSLNRNHDGRGYTVEGALPTDPNLSKQNKSKIVQIKEGINLAVTLPSSITLPQMHLDSDINANDGLADKIARRSSTSRCFTDHLIDYSSETDIPYTHASDRSNPEHTNSKPLSRASEFGSIIGNSKDMNMSVASYFVNRPKDVSHIQTNFQQVENAIQVHFPETGPLIATNHDHRKSPVDLFLESSNSRDGSPTKKYHRTYDKSKERGP